MNNSIWSFAYSFLCAGAVYFVGDVFLTPFSIFAAAALICRAIEEG